MISACIVPLVLTECGEELDITLTVFEQGNFSHCDAAAPCQGFFPPLLFVLLETAFKRGIHRRVPAAGNFQVAFRHVSGLGNDPR